MRTRSLAEVESSGERIWFQPALDLLASPHGVERPEASRLMKPGLPALIARAPGRLDVMGGIADYSGSVVLELPLARSTFAILQPRRDGRIELLSLRSEAHRAYGIDARELLESAPTDPRGLGERLREEGEEWAAYVLGVVQLCLRLSAGSATTESDGFSLLIHSQVPEGKGVSSSAALEVATMTAICAHLRVDLPGVELAAACQWVENQVVGAPCGIMDQLTSTLGKQDRLLRLRCQPAAIEGYLEVPPEYSFYGIDSGIRHTVAGADYGTVRAAAFMGRTILAHGSLSRSAAGTATRFAANGGTYLADLTPEQFDAAASTLPERLSGAEFLARYGDHGDAATAVAPDRVYPVRQAARHPVLENARVLRFASLLGDLPDSSAAAEEMGRLMYASHESYSACGLGSDGTDRLVELARQAGPAAGLYGAKITGGGSGGTVAILGRRDAADEVRRIASRYGRETGLRTEIFSESGPGARITGVLEWRSGTGD